MLTGPCLLLPPRPPPRVLQPASRPFSAAPIPEAQRKFSMVSSNHCATLTRCAAAVAAALLSLQASAQAPSPTTTAPEAGRSEEHTSELQSPCNLVCRLLLEKKKEPRPGTVACLPKDL